MSLALLFSPQGSQAVGMGRALVDASPGAREVFERADAALGWSVSQLAFAGPEERLNDTRYTQPALVVMAVAAAHALSEALAAEGDDLAPAFVAGHSVGEYAALVIGEVLALEDAVRLVAVRGRADGRGVDRRRDERGHRARPRGGGGRHRAAGR